MIAKGRLKKVENSTLGPPFTIEIPQNKQIFASSDAKFCRDTRKNGC